MIFGRLFYYLFSFTPKETLKNSDFSEFLPNQIKSRAERIINVSECIMKNIEDILYSKSKGFDCTEEESAEVKHWLKNTILQIGSSDIEIHSKIQLLFPLEYGEYLDECRIPNEYIIQYCDSFGNIINVPYHLDSVEVISRELREVGIFYVYC